LKIIRRIIADMEAFRRSDSEVVKSNLEESAVGLFYAVFQRGKHGVKLSAKTVPLKAPMERVVPVAEYGDGNPLVPQSSNSRNCIFKELKRVRWCFENFTLTNQMKGKGIVTF
jgi:hypothetical protein